MNTVVAVIVTGIELLSLLSLIILLAAVARLMRDSTGLDKLLCEVEELHD